MIHHILADGREVSSMEGFLVSFMPATEAAYRLLVEFWGGGGRDGGAAADTRHRAQQETQEAAG